MTESLQLSPRGNLPRGYRSSDSGRPQHKTACEKFRSQVAINGIERQIAYGICHLGMPGGIRDSVADKSNPSRLNSMIPTSWRTGRTRRVRTLY